MNESTPASKLIVGVTTELLPGEKRVALVPGGVTTLRKAGLEVVVQSGCGVASGFPDDQYESAGATIVSDRATIFEKADILLQVNGLGAAGESANDDLACVRQGLVWISSCDPLTHPQPVLAAAERGASVFSLELVPRITRAQSMDVLSSMATVAGYRAVLLGAVAAPRMFPMMMTAAGTLKPARVLVIGVGVAGLQAIATAKRLGAIVYAYDIRPETREQVESLGGRFVVLDLGEDSNAQDEGGYARKMDDEFYRKQREAMTKVVGDADVVITTAAVPGKTAPTLVTTPMVEAMAPGSVLVDLAASRGGNCELTQPGKTIEHNGVTILGPDNLPAEIPAHASEMLSRNGITFLSSMLKDGILNIDTTDEIIRETLLSRGGEVVNERVQELLQPAQ